MIPLLRRWKSDHKPATPWWKSYHKSATPLLASMHDDGCALVRAPGFSTYHTILNTILIDSVPKGFRLRPCLYSGFAKTTPEHGMPRAGSHRDMSYSLALIICIVCTGRVPFRGVSMNQERR